MSIDYSTYIGPYVSCKTHKVDETRTKRTCSNTACAKHEHEVWDKNTQFCSACGAAIADREYVVQVDNVNASEIQVTLLAEALTRPLGDSMWKWMQDNNLHLWISNMLTIPGQERNFSFDPKYEEQYIPNIDQAMIDAEMERFTDRFEKEIELLRQEYGEYNVALQWGLVHYIH